MVERIEINLLPTEYRPRGTQPKIPRFVVYPVLIFVLLAIGAAFYTMHLKEKKAELERDIEKITKEIEANRHIQIELNKLREEKRLTEQKIRALERISVDREKWVRLLEILSRSMPSFTWLTSVREDVANNKLTLEARTYAFPEVAQYMTRLEETEYVNNVTLTGIEQQALQDRKVYKFTLIVALNRDVGLPPKPEGEEEAAAAPAANRGRGATKTKSGRGGGR